MKTSLSQKMLRTLVVSCCLLVSMPVFAYEGEVQGGGEDFPFFCETAEETEIRAFEVIVDDNSETGYKVRYHARLGRLQASFPISISDSEDGQHFVISGVENSPFRLFNRHIYARIAKDSRNESFGGFELLVKGFPSSIASRLLPIRCWIH